MSIVRRMRRRVRPSPILYDPYAPRYTLPYQVQYNGSTKRCDLTSATLTRLAYATDIAGTTPVTLANSGSTSSNQTALEDAINDAIAANGTALVHARRRIRLTPGAGEWGTGYEWNTALFDQNGIGCKLIIESTAVGSTLRAEGQRVGLDDAALMPVFGLTTYNVPAFRFFGNARRIRFVGIYFGISAASVVALRAGVFGRATTIPGNDAPFTYNGHLCYEHTLPPFAVREAGTPADIHVDRCVLIGDDEVRVRRLVYANFDRFACTDSYLECAGDYGGAPDSQAITCISAAGDHIVRNCGIYQAFGEHCIYGGGPTFGPQFGNADLVWMDNDLGFLDRWGPVTATNPGGRNFLHKNMWECKVAQRVLIEGNRIRNYYGYGRFLNQFRAIVFKASDQNEGEDFILSRDITCRLNLFERVSGVLQIVGGDRFEGAGDFKALHRLEFSFNANLPWDQAALGLGYSSASIVQYGHSAALAGLDGTVADPEKYLVTDLAIRYNTLWGSDAPGENYIPTLAFDMSYSATPSIVRLTLSNNLLAGVNPYPGWPLTITNSVNALGLPTDWTRTVRTGVVSNNNAMSGVTNQATQLTATLGASNIGVATFAGLQLNATTLQPNAGSPILGASEDGLNIGADWTLLTAATTRALTGRS